MIANRLMTENRNEPSRLPWGRGRSPVSWKAASCGSGGATGTSNWERSITHQGQSSVSETKSVQFTEMVGETLCKLTSVYKEAVITSVCHTPMVMITILPDNVGHGFHGAYRIPCFTRHMMYHSGPPEHSFLTWTSLWQQNQSMTAACYPTGILVTKPV